MLLGHDPRLHQETTPSPVQGHKAVCKLHRWPASMSASCGAEYVIACLFVAAGAQVTEGLCEGHHPQGGCDQHPGHPRPGGSL